MADVTHSSATDASRTASRGRWPIIAMFALIGAMLALASVLTGRRMYESSATLFVTSTGATSLRAALADDFGGGGSGLGGALGGSGQRDYIMALLQSTSCRLAVADALHLETNDEFWGGLAEAKIERSRDLVLRQLAALATVTQKEGLVKIAVRSASPKLAAQIAQAHLTYLDQRIGADNASKSTLLGKQVAAVRKRLAKSEKALRDFMASSAILPEEEAERAELNALVELNRQLVIQEIELTGTQSQLDAPGDLNRQIELKSLEAGAKARVEKLRTYISQREARLKTLPDALLAYQRLTRSVKLDERVLMLLSEQYNLALFQDAGRVVPYRIVDPPRVPDLPRGRNAVLKALLGMVVFGVFGAGVAQWLERRRAQRVAASSPAFP